MGEHLSRDSYEPGRPYGVCDRCGFTYRHDELKREWTGLLVCVPDLDPRPADMDPPNVYAEGLPVRDVLGENTTTAADL
jgi:hypothetical protein